MKKNLFVINRVILYCSIGSLIALQSCGLFGGKAPKDSQGQLTGVLGREFEGMEIPYGMIQVPSGTFHMGQSDEDVPVTSINLNKQVTIGGFYMDDTEITNNEYRQFMVVMLTDSVDVLGQDYI